MSYPPENPADPDNEPERIDMEPLPPPDEPVVESVHPAEAEPLPPEAPPARPRTAARRIIGLLLFTLLVIGGILLFAYFTYYRPLSIERQTLVEEARQLNTDLTDTRAELESRQQELAAAQATVEVGQEELAGTRINLALFRLQSDVLNVRLGLATGDTLSARTSLRLAEEDIQSLRQLGADEEVVRNLGERLNDARSALEQGDEDQALDELRRLSEDIRTIDRPR